MENSKINEVTELFRERYGREPRVFRAPGRVNLIGEHTDYNEGFVMPFAIDRETVTAGTVRDDTTVNILAVDVGESASFDLGDDPVKQRGTWLDYAEGVIRSLYAATKIERGADLVFSSTVPIGGGLSSSAALEVSIGLSILGLNDVVIDRKQLAFAAQKAEHEYVGIRSGIMDQFTSVFGREGNALLLDCRSLDVRYIPLSLGDAAIVVCDTKVKHSLASSEYNVRRSECEEGAALLAKRRPGITSLRDVTQRDLEEFGGDLPATILSRCRHVVTENARTLLAAEAFEKSEMLAAGELMFASHNSLRDDYEVSSPELDLLVDIAAGVDGVYGARMTGGGFGGCTVNLIRKNSVEAFKEEIAQRYKLKFAVEPEIYAFWAADGASETTAVGKFRLPTDASGSAT